MDAREVAMTTKTARIGLIVLFAPFILLAASYAVCAEAQYRETIAALRAVYLDESRAQIRYGAFAKKAQAEGYPQIAYFFTALSESEGVHARNARHVLHELSSEIKDEPFKAVVETTKENLNFATTFEIKIIEQVFPGFLKKIIPENHASAIQTLRNELETERMHLELLRKIRKGTGVFFGMLVKKFEGTPVDYFICQMCGATTINLPKAACPVCKADVAEYKAVKMSPGK